MNIRFVSKDLEWTDDMKDCVRQKIVEPLRRHFKHAEFEMSVTLSSAKKLEMWIVLQTFDGRHNEVLRRTGRDFGTLTNEVSSSMRAQLKRTVPVRRNFLFNPFKLLPFERSHQRIA